MNQRLKDTLDQYSDIELAFLNRYKVATYTKPTQEKVLAYIKDRRLTTAKMEALVTEWEFYKFKDHKVRCPRCTTEKLRIQDVAWDNPSYSSWQTMDALLFNKAAMKEQIECTVCEYWVKDPNNQGQREPFWAKMRRKYGK